MVDWLHISDLHLGRSVDWREDTVLAHLQRDLPGLLKEAGLEPRLVFVTGDLAWSGKAEQYDVVHKFLADLLEGLGLEPGQALCLVPGNHDVDRGAIGRGAKLIQESLLKPKAEAREAFREAVGELLAPRELRELGARLGAYCAFTGRLLGAARAVSPDRPFRTDVRELSGVAVGVASLASSWLCGPDDDSKGRIVLGERQAREALKELADGGADLRIVLLHHPLEWLHEAEDRAVRELLQAEADVVLHGHLHEADIGAAITPFGTCAVSAAGAAYAGAGWQHGFSAARFDPASGELTTHVFKYASRGGGRWVVEHDLGPRARDGRIVVQLRSLLARPLASTQGVGATDALGARLKHAVARVYDRVDFVGLADAAPKPKTKLDELYVPASFTRKWSTRYPEEELVETLCSLGELERSLFASLTPLESERRAHRFVVLGDPGSGKTTLLLHVALAAAERQDTPIPALVKLREYVRQGRRDGLLSFAADEHTELLQVPTTAEQLARAAEQGLLLLLVDGLDEVVDEDDRARVRDLLAGFAASYPRSPVLATSRIVGYDHAPLPDSFATLRLQPFGDDEIKDFVARWYQVAIPEDPRERERRIADLLAALEREPRAKALARVPLLATLIALVHRFETNLPGERAALYETCVKTLVVTWPRARGRRFPDLDESLQRTVLEQLALRMQEARGERQQPRREEDVTIARAELRRAFVEIFAQRGIGSSAAERAVLAERWVRWLEADTGLLVEQQPGVFGFLHLSLLEYLAGRALLEREGSAGDEAVAEFIGAHHRQAHWRETCLLALDSEGTRRKLIDECVERVRKRAAEDKGEAWSSCVFLIALLREEVDVLPEARTEIFDEAAKAALEVWPGTWTEAKDRLSDVLVFGRRHGEALRAWLRERLLKSNGDALVGAVALAPDELDIAAVLCKVAF